MTPADYARVKQVFAAAIQRPEDERAAYVREQCANAIEIETEVLELLQHHREATILAPVPQTTLPKIRISKTQSTKTFADCPPLKDLDVVDEEAVETYLVSSNVWDENRQILRRRLIVIACAMSVLIAISIFRLFTHYYASLGYGARAVSLAISLGVAWLLYTKHDLTLRQIRIAEFAVMANAGVLAAVIYVRLMLDLAEEEFTNEATLISANNWNYFVWTMIIFIYGVFMPNTWRRATAVLVPVALMPTLVTVTANAIDPSVAEVLGTDDFGRPIPTPFVAAGIAIYAAHLIHGARLSAFRAKYLAQYHLKRLIGEGGMGQVYEAEHLLLKRACAIKVIRPEHCIDDHALQRFEREVQATAKLTHPHTIDVYDFGQTKDGVFFFAMELLPGMNLADLVASAGPLPAGRVVHFLTEICAALQEAHGAGLIHRDIKPANVFASQRGGIWDFTKLLDFGLVRETSVDPNRSLTSGLIAGSPGFMSPEQVSSPAEIDPRSDLYSVAAVGYFLLTGKPPFSGESVMKIMIAQATAEPPAPSTIRPDVPADVESIISKCLAIDPNDRIATAGQVRAALQQCGSAGTWSEQDAAQWWADREPPPG